jgi:hypothetical protein
MLKELWPCLPYKAPSLGQDLGNSVKLSISSRDRWVILAFAAVEHQIEEGLTCNPVLDVLRHPYVLTMIVLILPEGYGRIFLALTVQILLLRVITAPAASAPKRLAGLDMASRWPAGVVMTKQQYTRRRVGCQETLSPEPLAILPYYLI